MNNFNEILKICKEYEKCDTYCYRLCNDISNEDNKSKRWLVIMSKQSETKIFSIQKFLFQEEYHYFYGYFLKVVKIIDVQNPHSDSDIKQVITKQKLRYSGNARIRVNKIYTIKYEINEIVSTQKNNIKTHPWLECYSGIKPTYYCGSIPIPDNYTGFWMEKDYYHGNFSGWIECNYKNGKKDGISIGWDVYGRKEFEKSYTNGVKNGNYIRFDYATGGKSEEYFVNGKKQGPVRPTLSGESITGD